MFTTKEISSGQFSVCVRRFIVSAGWVKVVFELGSKVVRGMQCRLVYYACVKTTRERCASDARVIREWCANVAEVMHEWYVKDIRAVQEWRASDAQVTRERYWGDAWLTCEWCGGDVWVFREWCGSDTQEYLKLRFIGLHITSRPSDQCHPTFTKCSPI